MSAPARAARNKVVRAGTRCTLEASPSPAVMARRAMRRGETTRQPVQPVRLFGGETTQRVAMRQGFSWNCQAVELGQAELAGVHRGARGADGKALSNGVGRGRVDVSHGDMPIVQGHIAAQQNSVASPVGDGRVKHGHDPR